MIFTALQEEVLMKKVLDTYSSKNDINIKQIVAYKDNILEIEEYKDGFKKDDTMNVMSVTKSVTSLLIKSYPKVKILINGMNFLMRLRPCLTIQSH